MKRDMRRIPSVFSILVFLFFTLPLAGQQSWEAVSSLKPGDRVKVQDKAGNEKKGSLRAVAANAITIATLQGEETVERTRVRRVQVKSSSRRVRNILIGAAIGAAVGIVADQTLGTYFRNESGESGAARALTYVAPIGLFGGIGAAASGYRTIYRAR